MFHKINDLPTGILSTVGLYTDDAMLYTTVNSVDNYHQLLALLERNGK